MIGYMLWPIPCAVCLLRFHLCSAYSILCLYIQGDTPTPHIPNRYGSHMRGDGAHLFQICDVFLKLRFSFLLYVAVCYREYPPCLRVRVLGAQSRGPIFKMRGAFLRVQSQVAWISKSSRVSIVLNISRHLEACSLSLFV